MEKGLLITLEGIDGSGKSSTAQALTTALSSLYTVMCTREPGATPLGTSIRELVHHATTPLCPRAEFLLFAADRAQHSRDVVQPYLAQGYLVISDRMADSSVAYQGYGRGLDTAFIKMVNEWALQGVKPDLTLYLRIEYPVAQQRIERRAERKTSLEQEQASFFKRVSDGFDVLFKEQPHVRIIDASQPQATVHAEALQHVLAFICQRERIV